jgi:HSP20 family protein
MANTRATPTRDEQQSQHRQQTGQPTARAGETRSTESTPGAERERSIRTTRDGATGRGATTARSSSIAPVYGTPAAASPFGLMRRMAEDMDRIFEDFGFAGPGFALSPLLSSSFDRNLTGMSPSRASAWAPQLETFRRGDNLVVRADLPGLRKEDVEVEIDNGVLTIAGERAEEQVEHRDDYYRSERSYGRFHRALPLPEGVTGETCEATFKDGVLEVTLPMPKQPERKARQIQIR